MQSFGDELDRESAASESTSDNEQDANAETREDGDLDAEADPDADGEQYVDNEEENAEEEESQYSFGDTLAKGQTKHLPAPQVPLLNNDPAKRAPEATRSGNTAPTSAPNPSVLLSSPSPTQESSPATGLAYGIPKVRPEAVTASVYDVVPMIAAPHSTSINAITATPDLRWVFSGGADGYIRKFNWIETANGKSMLTVAQRHPFVDSVTKAGVLMNYWENNEDASYKPSEDGSSISPVYSLATQREGLWLLSGLESGGINLQSIRVEEGKIITALRGHSSAVSVLNLAQDERSLLSGSWDKTVLDWDLNTGKVIRTFEGSGGQISALESRPLSNVPVPPTVDEVKPENGTFSTDDTSKPRLNGMDTSFKDQDASQNESGVGDTDLVTAASPADSLFGGGDADSLFGDNENMDIAPSGGNFVDEDDDFSRAIANGIREQEQTHDHQSLDQPRSGDGDIDMVLFQDGSNATTFGGDGNILDPPSKNLESAGIFEGDIEIPDSSMDIDGPLLHSDQIPPISNGLALEDPPPPDTTPKIDSTFLAASIDGSIRIWDKRQPNPVAKLTPRNVPPWCMNATWSPDGNYIFAGRRNGTVDEYSLHHNLSTAARSFKLPNNSGAVSALKAMPNGRHLLCASYDIIRLYDLQQKQIFKHATVPFLIVPGHRTGVVSQLYVDPACRYLISIAGNRGWEGSSTEVLLGYEIFSMTQ